MRRGSRLEISLSLLSACIRVTPTSSEKTVCMALGILFPAQPSLAQWCFLCLVQNFLVGFTLLDPLLFLACDTLCYGEKLKVYLISGVSFSFAKPHIFYCLC